jgi:hypothetical protein
MVLKYAADERPPYDRRTVPIRSLAPGADADISLWYTARGKSISAQLEGDHPFQQTWEYSDFPGGLQGDSSEGGSAILDVYQDRFVLRSRTLFELFSDLPTILQIVMLVFVGWLTFMAFLLRSAARSSAEVRKQRRLLGLR